MLSDLHTRRCCNVSTLSLKQKASLLLYLPSIMRLSFFEVKFSLIFPLFSFKLWVNSPSDELLCKLLVLKNDILGASKFVEPVHVELPDKRGVFTVPKMPRQNLALKQLSVSDLETTLSLPADNVDDRGIEEDLGQFFGEAGIFFSLLHNKVVVRSDIELHNKSLTMKRKAAEALERISEEDRDNSKLSLRNSEQPSSESNTLKQESLPDRRTDRLFYPHEPPKAEEIKSKSLLVGKSLGTANSQQLYQFGNQAKEVNGHLPVTNQNEASILQRQSSQLSEQLRKRLEERRKKVKILSVDAQKVRRPSFLQSQKKQSIVASDYRTKKLATEASSSLGSNLKFQQQGFSSFKRGSQNYDAMSALSKNYSTRHFEPALIKARPQPSQKEPLYYSTASLHDSQLQSKPTAQYKAPGAISYSNPGPHRVAQFTSVQPTMFHESATSFRKGSDFAQQPIHNVPLRPANVKQGFYPYNEKAKPGMQKAQSGKFNYSNPACQVLLEKYLGSQRCEQFQPKPRKAETQCEQNLSKDAWEKEQLRRIALEQLKQRLEQRKKHQRQYLLQSAKHAKYLL